MREAEGGPEDWAETNRRMWDERVAVHLAPGGYDLEGLRAGRGRLDAIEEGELARLVGSLAGKRIIHLQCHFGADSLTLAQRGAEVVGVDFSPAAVAAARALAEEVGLAQRCRFVESDLYAAPGAVGEAGSFDLAYVTWGAICWLPDIRGWAEVVAGFLRPGGRLYLAEGHPAALVFDDAAAGPDGFPGRFVPYFDRKAYQFEETADYSNPEAVLERTQSVSWVHPLGDVLGGLLDAGFALRHFREHDAVSWRMFGLLQPRQDGLWGWPDRPWLPLAFSLLAEKAG